jgi:hypothetical protein
MKPLAFIADSISVLAESSAVIEGMTYEWGAYRPPGTYDLLFIAVVARAAGQTRALRSASDWGVALAGAGLEVPAMRAQQACREVITYAGPRRDVGIRPIIFTGPASLARLFQADQDSLSKLHLEPPEVARDDTTGRSLVTLWAIEAGQTTRYHCEFGPGENVNLTAVDSVYGLGFQPRGP